MTGQRGVRRCGHCGQALPATATAKRKWCDDRCRMAATRERSRPASGLTARLQKQVAAQVSLAIQAETEAGQLKAKLAERDRIIGQLRRELADERRRSADALTGQLNRSAAVRDQLAVATDQVATLRRAQAASEQAVISPEVAAKMRAQLSSLRTAHAALQEQYGQLARAAELAAAQRAQLQTVIRQWDRLCRRLHAATDGRPTNDGDRAILTTWGKFRTALATAPGQRGRTQPATATSTKEHA